VDSSTTRQKGGSGLGLSIAKRIVELHGGRMYLESEVGRGSTFGFVIPIRCGEHDVVEEQHAHTDR
jgi:signal transduction histidine kinase